MTIPQMKKIAECLLEIQQISQQIGFSENFNRLLSVTTELACAEALKTYDLPVFVAMTADEYDRFVHYRFDRITFPANNLIEEKI